MTSQRRCAQWLTVVAAALCLVVAFPIERAQAESDVEVAIGELSDEFFSLRTEFRERGRAVEGPDAQRAAAERQRILGSLTVLELRLDELSTLEGESADQSGRLRNAIIALLVEVRCVNGDEAAASADFARALARGMNTQEKLSLEKQPAACRQVAAADEEEGKAAPVVAPVKKTKRPPSETSKGPIAGKKKRATTGPSRGQTADGAVQGAADPKRTPADPADKAAAKRALEEAGLVPITLVPLEYRGGLSAEVQKALLVRDTGIGLSIAGMASFAGAIPVLIIYYVPGLVTSITAGTLLAIGAPMWAAGKKAALDLHPDPVRLQAPTLAVLPMFAPPARTADPEAGFYGLQFSITW